VTANSQRYQRLLDGDRSSELAPVGDPVLRAGLADRAQAWRTQLAPMLETIVAAPTPEQARANVQALEPLLDAARTN